MRFLFDILTCNVHVKLSKVFFMLLSVLIYFLIKLYCDQVCFYFNYRPLYIYFSLYISTILHFLYAKSNMYVSKVCMLLLHFYLLCCFCKKKKKMLLKSSEAIFTSLLSQKLFWYVTIRWTVKTEMIKAC